MDLVADSLDNVRSLLDLSAQAVGRNVEPMVIIDRTMDEHLYKKVLYHAFPSSISAAGFMKTLSSDEVRYDTHNIERWSSKLTSLRQVGFMLVAEFASDHVNVRVEFAKGQITAASCSKCNKCHGCIHVYVAVISRTKGDSKIQIHPPLTEGLMTLNQDRLKRVLNTTIAKDPMYMLDLIQQCNEEEDADSSENIHDPTVSCVTSSDAIIEQALRKHLKQNLKNFTNIAVGYEWKTRWYLHNYMKKAVELSRVNIGSPLPLMYLDGIGRHTAKLAANTFFIFQGDPDDEPHLLLHDLNVYSASVFPQRNDPVTTDNIDIERWKAIINDSQKYFEEYGTHRFMLKCSHYVELPRIYPLYEDKVEQVFGLDRQALSQGYFSEMLASLFIPPPPPEYWDLVSGNISPMHSTYNEPLSIMMARANAYMFSEPLAREGEFIKSNRKRFNEENKTHEKEQLRLIDHILIKLAKLGLKYSILSVVGKTINIQSRDLRDKPFLRFIMEASADIELTSAKVNSRTERQTPDVATDASQHQTANKSDDKSSSSRNKACNNTSDHLPTTSIQSRKRKSISSKHDVAEKRRKSGRLEKLEEQEKQHEERSKIRENVQDDLGPVYPTYTTESESYTSPDPVPPGNGLKKGQLAYCLMYWLIRRGELSKDIQTPHKDIIEGIHLLALELARYSLTSKRKEPYAKELYLLTSMENRVKELAFHPDFGRNGNSNDGNYTFEYQTWIYISAWHHFGFQFYADNIPFVLGNCIFYFTHVISYDECERGHFGTPNHATQRALLRCCFIRLEERDLYTFHRKGLGPYSPVEPPERPPRRYPLEATYGKMLSDYFRFKDEENRKPVLDKIQQIIDNSFRTPIKTIPRTMWRAMKKHLYMFGQAFKEALEYGDICAEYNLEEHLLFLKLSVYLCDVYEGGQTDSPYRTPDKYCQAVIATCKTLGAKYLGHLDALFKNKKWSHFLTHVHMECILRYFERELQKLSKPLKDVFYSYVLDICKLQQDSYNLKNEYKYVKIYKYVIDFESTARTSELLGINTGQTCTDVLKFLENIGGVKRIGKLTLKAITVLVCHTECDGCNGALKRLLNEGEFSVNQVICLIEEALEFRHLNNARLYSLLEMLKPKKLSKNLKFKVFSEKLVTWVLLNIRCELSNKMDKPSPVENVVGFIESEYKLFIDNVDIDLSTKKNKFKEMIEKKRKDDKSYTWRSEDGMKWTEELVDSLNKVLV